jgi:NitT/TauT family transport system substrate-binding protein
VAVALLVLLGGCGEDEQPASAPTPVRVAVLPVADVAPLYLGARKGFFRAERLSVEPRLMASGAEITAAALSGDVNVGFSSLPPLLLARSRRLGVQIISQGVQAAPAAEDAWDRLLVDRDGPIRRARDLEGRTIAVNARRNMNELCVRAVLARRGVDVSSVRFAKVPFPQMPAALRSGRVDAIAAVEPFVSVARGDGARGLLSYFAGLNPRMTVATYFATESFIETNTDTVTRFARAMRRSLRYAQSHPDEVRAIVPTYTRIPAEVAQRMALPYWSTDLNQASIELVSSLSRRFGEVAEPPSVRALIWSGATSG